MQPEIIIDRDQVTIEGVVVRRPDSISPSQWLEFWERAVDDNEDD
jgi:hypothetical protein